MGWFHDLFEGFSVYRGGFGSYASGWVYSGVGGAIELTSQHRANVRSCTAGFQNYY